MDRQTDIQTARWSHEPKTEMIETQMDRQRGDVISLKPEVIATHMDRQTARWSRKRLFILFFRNIVKCAKMEAGDYEEWMQKRERSGIRRWRFLSLETDRETDIRMGGRGRGRKEFVRLFVSTAHLDRMHPNGPAHKKCFDMNTASAAELVKRGCHGIF
jgi:hypothetical protein